MHWTIKRKLLLVFVFVAAMMLGGTGVAHWAQVQAERTEQEIRATAMVLKDVEHLGSYVRAVTAMQRAYLISGRSEAVAAVPAMRREADGVTARVKAAVAGNAAQTAALERWQDLLLERRAYTNKIVAARRDQGFNAAKAIFDTGEDDRLYAAMQDVFDEMTAAATSQLQEKEAASQNLQHAIALTELFGVLASLLVLSGLAFVLTRSIARNIHTSNQLLEAMAQRDLSIAEGVPVSDDELADAIHAINRMKQSMAEALREVSQASAEVAGTGAEIESAAGQIAVTAHTEQKNVEIFASSLAELSASVKEVAENAEHASAAAGDAVSSATSGRNLVRETHAAMNRIRESVATASTDIEKLGEVTHSIGEVVRIIQEIAEQTNLLALNAAIEAARAGEQGKGFAVVAQEVRQLAERTANFTKEIAAKIESVQKGAVRAVQSMTQGQAEVDEGVRKFTDVNEALETILLRIEGAEKGIAMIAAATTEQSAATTGLTENVQNISVEVDRTAQQVQQTANACAELARLGAGLESLVNTFQLPPALETGPASKPSPSRRRAA